MVIHPIKKIFETFVCIVLTLSFQQTLTIPMYRLARNCLSRWSIDSAHDHYIETNTHFLTAHYLFTVRP